MKRSKKLIQAYKQAPWRGKAQLIAAIAAAVAVIGLVAALYLDVTARAATAGRAVQELQQAREQLEQEIEDQETKLAYLRSVSVMRQRADKLGFEVVSPGSITYLSVPGYVGRGEAQLAPAPGALFSAAARLPETYTQSLFDWFGQLFSSVGGF